MAEINTFSALIDDAIARTGRSALKNDIVSYARQTLRELQMAIKSPNDMVEDELTADGDGYIWNKPQYFREMLTVKYPAIYDPYGKPIFPKRLQPSKLQNDSDYFYYMSGTSFVFKGVSANTLIHVAYLQWLPKLMYYATAADRPARYEFDTVTLTYAWVYATATTSEEQAAAQDAVTNWLIFDWYDLVLEGTCAKIYKSINDPRMQSSFALYKALQKDFVVSLLADSYSGDYNDA